MITGDFNNDGQQDVATANEFDNTVSVLLGNGDGTFQPQAVYAVGPFPFSIATADFNADGNLDLAVNSENCQFYSAACPAGTVSILFGNGDGTFQPQVAYQAGIWATGVVTGDLAGIGSAGLATANEIPNTVSVWHNLPVISVFPNSIQFGKETVGSRTQAHTITIGNPSGAPINISSVTATGTDPGDFPHSNTCPISPATLAPGDTCTISVEFKPTASGKRSATISVTDSVPGSPQSIALSGDGT